MHGTGTADRRTWPAGLAGMIVLVIATEWCVSWNEGRLMTPGTLVWSANSRAATGEALGAEILGLGDSLVMHGMAPAVIEARLGRRAYNLAVPSGQPAANLFLLRRMLRAGARPSAILLDGELLEHDPLTLAAVWAELATLPECAELAWAARDVTFFNKVAAARALPSSRRRADIRARIMSALAGTAVPEDALTGPLRRNLARNRGAYILDAPAGPLPADPRPAVLAAYQPTDWSIHPLNARFLVEFLDLAAARGVRVFWLLPPLYSELQARREKYGRDAAYIGFIGRLQRRYPHLVVIDGRHAGYAATAVADLVHLNRRGAAAYSDALATVLRDQLALPPARAPRWVDLPGYRDEPGAVALEDLSASGAALKRALR